MEVIAQDIRRWPDPDRGPHFMRLTIGVVDGRPAPIGLELWSVSPLDLDKRYSDPGRWIFVSPNWKNRPDYDPDNPSTWGDLPSRPLTSKEIRVPLRGLVDEKMAKEALAVSELRNAGTKSRGRGSSKEIGALAFIPEDIIAAFQVQADRVERVAGVRTGRGGRPAKYDRAFYETVAQIYKDALSKGRNPNGAVLAVAREKGATKSQVDHWIAKCRNELGLLSKTTRGKPKA